MEKTINTEIEAYLKVKEETGLMGQDLNKYVYYLGLMKKENTLKLVGIDAGILNINK